MSFLAGLETNYTINEVVCVLHKFCFSKVQLLSSDNVDFIDMDRYWRKHLDFFDEQSKITMKNLYWRKHLDVDVQKCFC